MKFFKELQVLGLLLLFSNWCFSIRVLVGPDLTTYQGYILTLTNGTVSEVCTIQVPDLPIPDVVGHSQTFIDGKLVICGGTGPGNFIFEFCFELDQNKNEWFEFPPMPFQRTFATAIWTNGTKWWLTGGYEEAHTNPVKSTVYYDTAEGSWAVGPDLPSIRAEGHCIVDLLDGTRLLFNGKTTPDSYDQNNFYRQSLNGTWEKMRGETNLTPDGKQTCVLVPNGDVMNIATSGGETGSVDVWNSKWGYWRFEEHFELPTDSFPSIFHSSITDEIGNIYTIRGLYPIRFDLLVWNSTGWEQWKSFFHFSKDWRPKMTPIQNDQLKCN